MSNMDVQYSINTKGDLLISNDKTRTFLNIIAEKENKSTKYINLQEQRIVKIDGWLNDIKDIDIFIRSINQTLQKEYIIIGKAKTYSYHKKIQLQSGISGRIIYFLKVCVHRIFPKLHPFLNHVYLSATKGKNQYLSHTEVLGRLIKNGFNIISEEVDEKGILSFAVEKNKHVEKSYPGSYWPIFKMRRVGKNGKIVFVYKIRTMHSHAEYLQEYVRQKSGLESSGKFLSDPRITSWGRHLRRYWLDEIPMIINLLKGEIKLIGVRPISFNFLNLYPESLKQKRKNFKPGLLPPYYADMPSNFDEILASEEKYLNAYAKNPLLTDWKYFWRIVFNIIFKRARSK